MPFACCAKAVKAPKQVSAGLLPGTKRVPRGCPEAGPQGPDAEHQAQGTKTARPEPPQTGQEDVRLKDENRKPRYEDCDVGEAVDAVL